MTMRISYPSEDFPPPIGFTIDVPDTWNPLAVPGVQMAVAEPRAERRFRANVVLTVQRCPSGFGLEQAQEQLESRKASLPDLEEIGTGRLEIEDHSWLASEYGYTQPGHRTVLQTVRCTVVPRSAHVSDVVEVVASCGSEDAESQIEVLRRIQDSVRLAG
jgi:hypothetical protein